MPRRRGYLWEEVTSFANLEKAFLKARRGKRARPAVARFDFQRETELARLRHELLDGTYQPGPFRTFAINDGKPRIISAAPFRDRIAHHALCAVLEPIFERRFIFDSYACRVGKGTHRAVKRYQGFAKKFRYVLKCDVRRFFPSVDHAILMDLLTRRIKDARVLALAEHIIHHGRVDEPPLGYFQGDDLFTYQDRPRGLPIGNQTSQFFGNVMLDPLDKFIKHELRCSAYLRYADDFVLLHDDKLVLAQWRARIEERLWALRLWLHPNKRVISRTCDGLNILGFRVWPKRRRLTAAGARRFRKRLRQYLRRVRQGRLTPRGLSQRLAAWIGHAQHADTLGLRRRLLGGIRV